MNLYEANYSMGGIANGGYFKSVVAANKESDVRGLLSEEHMEDINSLKIEKIPVDNIQYSNVVIDTWRR